MIFESFDVRMTPRPLLASNMFVDVRSDSLIIAEFVLMRGFVDIRFDCLDITLFL